ncbi:ankyrin repeat domain-containing protein 50-like [Mytilus trossulus]|uniref:ankyrin repeat domain-containing protein 50-like n=1 Tax=Mytilus trossulus TaxID=6551 RepID=UPI003005C3C0
MDQCQDKEMMLKAVAQRKIKLIKLLLDGGVDVNFQGYDGKTPLIVACSFLHQNEETDSMIMPIYLLIKGGANINAQDMKGRSALMYAVRHVLETDIIQMLLDNGADPNILDDEGRKTYYYIRRNIWPRYKSILRKYLKSQHDTNITENHHYTHDLQTCQDKEMILKAVAQRKIKLVKLLLDGGVDVNFKGYDGKTPLIVACSFLHQNEDSDSMITLINLLIKGGANVNAQDKKGRTALMYAVRHVLATDIIQLLLDNGADPNILDDEGRNTYYFIRRNIWPRYKSILRKYLRSQHDTQVTENNRHNHGLQQFQDKEMILKAVAQRKTKLVKLLLDGGVDVNFKGYDGKTPLIVACSFLLQNDDNDSMITLINLLIKGGAKVNAQDMKGRTALMYAVRHVLATDIIQLLLDNGADPNILDDEGRNTYYFIRRNIWPRYRSILRKYLRSQHDTQVTENNRHNHGLQQVNEYHMLYHEISHSNDSKSIVTGTLDNIHRRASDSFASGHPNKVKLLPKRKSKSYSYQSGIVCNLIHEENENGNTMEGHIEEFRKGKQN